MWSIKNQDPATGPTQNCYSLILSVVLEEMLHMGLACNMLTTIGGTPHLVVPPYPGPLPGGVRPELKEVYLSGLTPAVVEKVFMQIEMPEHPVPTEALVETHPTIGAFYDAIAKAFARAGESIIKSERQLSTSFSNKEALYPITSLACAQKAIKEIKEQGEGQCHGVELVRVIGACSVSGGVRAICSHGL